MGFDLGHTISSLAKLALRTKRNIDKQGGIIMSYNLGRDEIFWRIGNEETPESPIYRVSNNSLISFSNSSGYFSISTMGLHAPAK